VQRRRSRLQPDHAPFQERIQMADVTVASGTQSIAEAPLATRRVFEAPAVEDLGRLQQLTQMLQVTAEP
jgi:hypothetical protein